MENHDLQFLIIGLGNPGRQYVDNRHNIGFILVSRLAERLGVTFSRMESNALVTKGDYKGRRIILAKPQTYMNLSGQPVNSLVNFYKFPLENLLIIYDDVDLPLEALRLRPGGGSSGHKGMKSIIERLGTQDFPRMRLGIGRPPGRKGAANYVLKNFSKDETEFLPEILERSVNAVLTFVTEGLETAMNQYNYTRE
jgi:PTH1 family peptidyl-tRNA hydrolase